MRDPSRRQKKHNDNKREPCGEACLQQDARDDDLVDSAGRTLYIFTEDTNGKDTACTPQGPWGAECPAIWPALTSAGAPRAGSGAKASLLGIYTRRDGKRQVTYNHHPLYYFHGDPNTPPGDKKPGDARDRDSPTSGTCSRRPEPRSASSVFAAQRLACTRVLSLGRQKAPHRSSHHPWDSERRSTRLMTPNKSARNPYRMLREHDLERSPTGCVVRQRLRRARSCVSAARYPGRCRT